MKHTVDIDWKGRRRFEAHVGGHTLVMDAPARVGGEDQGTIPKPLVLTALAGCTGMDVAALLEKGGHPIDSLTIAVDGELSRGQPMRYTSVHMTYDMTGPEQSSTPAVAAVETSQGQLCGVSAMLQRIIPVSWEIRYNGRSVHRGHAGLEPVGVPERSLKADESQFSR